MLLIFFLFFPTLFSGHCFIFVLLGLYYDSVHWWLPEWSHWGRCRSSYCCCILVTYYVLDTSAYLYKQRQTSHTQYFSFIPGFTGNISRSVQIMPSGNLFLFFWVLNKTGWNDFSFLIWFFFFLWEKFKENFSFHPLI